MNTKWVNFQSVIIVILVLIILFLTKCGEDDIRTIVKEKTITKTEVKYDTVVVENKTDVIKWKYKIDTVTVLVPQKVDTAFILKDYYTKYLFVDTLELDTLGFIVINDTVQKNTILNRTFSSEIIVPSKQIKTTDIIYINEREMYGGVNMRIGNNKVDYMGLEGTLRGVNGNLFTVGFGVNNENKLSVGGGVLWKIK